MGRKPATEEMKQAAKERKKERQRRYYHERIKHDEDFIKKQLENRKTTKNKRIEKKEKFVEKMKENPITLHMIHKADTFARFEYQQKINGKNVSYYHVTNFRKVDFVYHTTKNRLQERVEPEMKMKLRVLSQVHRESFLNQTLEMDDTEESIMHLSYQKTLEKQEEIRKKKKKEKELGIIAPKRKPGRKPIPENEKIIKRKTKKEKK